VDESGAQPEGSVGGGGARVEVPDPAVVVLVGPSGAGKSTWAEANFGPDEIVSSDRLRAVVGRATDDLDATDDAFTLLDAIVAARARRRLTVVVDTLALDTGRRAAYRAVAAEHGLPCVAVAFDTDAETCRARNRAKPRPVPAPALKQQLARWSEVRDGLGAEGFDAVVRPDPVRHIGERQAAMRTQDAPHVTDARRTPAVVGDARSGAARTVAIGLHVSAFPWDDVAAGLRATAIAAEAAGVAAISVMDHVRQIPQVGRDWDPILEPYTTLAWMAAVTERVRLGPLVSPVTFRNVGLLAKQVATIDVLSGGRAVCGLGLGWYEREHLAYGWAFPSVDDRYRLLEDALVALPKLWGPGAKPFSGSVLELPETIGYPRPVQAHVPIVLGGGGERRTLRLAARFADAVNVQGPVDVVRRKVEVLRAHCEDVGRDPADVRVTVLLPSLLAADRRELRALVERLRPGQIDAERYAASVGAATVEDHLERVGALHAVGVDEVVVALADLGVDTGGVGDPVGHLAALVTGLGGGAS
jgi:F420-dependent oxidoreductase-like protein